MVELLLTGVYETVASASSLGGQNNEYKMVLDATALAYHLQRPVCIAPPLLMKSSTSKAMALLKEKHLWEVFNIKTIIPGRPH